MAINQEAVKRIEERNRKLQEEQEKKTQKPSNVDRLKGLFQDESPGLGAKAFQEVRNILRPITTPVADYFSEPIKQTVAPQINKYLIQPELKRAEELLTRGVRNLGGTGIAFAPSKPGREKEEIARLQAETNKTPIGKIIDVENRLTRTAASGVLGGAETLSDFAVWRGVDSAKPLSDKINIWRQSLASEDPNFIDALGSGIGSAVWFYLPGMGITSAAQGLSTVSPRVAMFFGGAAATALEAMSESGGVYSEMIRMGKGKKEADAAATKTFWINALLVGITNQLGIFGESKNMLKRSLFSAGFESLQEMGQQITSNVLTGRPWDEGIYEAGGVGAIIGGFTSLGTGVQLQNDIQLAPYSIDHTLADLANKARVAGDPILAKTIRELKVPKSVKTVKQLDAFVRSHIPRESAAKLDIGIQQRMNELESYKRDADAKEIYFEPRTVEMDQPTIIPSRFRKAGLSVEFTNEDPNRQNQPSRPNQVPNQQNQQSQEETFRQDQTIREETANTPGRQVPSGGDTIINPQTPGGGERSEVNLSPLPQRKPLVPGGFQQAETGGASSNLLISSTEELLKSLQAQFGNNVPDTIRQELLNIGNELASLKRGSSAIRPLAPSQRAGLRVERNPSVRQPGRRQPDAETSNRVRELRRRIATIGGAVMFSRGDPRVLQERLERKLGKTFTLGQVATQREQAGKSASITTKKIEQKVAGRREAAAKREGERQVFKTKRIEQRAAERQVAAERREGGRRVGKAKEQARKDIQRTRVEVREEMLEKARRREYAQGDFRKQVRQYAKEFLETKDQGRAIRMVEQAKTERDVIKAFIRIDRIAEEAAKKTTRNKIVKLLKRALESPNVAIEYKQKLKDLIGQFELYGRRQSTLAKLRAIKREIEAKQEVGEDVEVSSRIYEALQILNRKPFAEVNLRELQGVLAEAEILEALGVVALDNKKAMYDMEQDFITQELVKGTKALDSIPMLRPLQGENLNKSQKVRNYIVKQINTFNNMGKYLSPIDVLMDILDGSKGTYDGPNFRFIKARMDNGWSNFLDLKDEMQEPILDFVDRVKLRQSNLERAGIVAAREQKDGRQKLLNGGYLPEEIDRIELTKEEQQFLDMVKNAFGEQYPFVVQIMADLYNEPVGKVENYVPFITDWKSMDDLEIQERLGSKAKEFEMKTKKTPMSFVKARVGAGEQKIKVDLLQIFLQHTENVAYMRAMAKDIKMLSEIVKSEEYGRAAGNVGQLLMEEYMDTMARKGGAAGREQIAVLDMFRKNISAGVLGLKVTSAAIQWTALIDGAGAIGSSWTIRGSADFAKSKDWRKFILKFPELRDRAGGEVGIRELEEGTWLSKLQKRSFIALQTMDKVAAFSIAAGAYQKKMAEMGKEIDLAKEPDPKAMAYAQLMVRRTQGSSTFKDVPLSITRGLGFAKNRSIAKSILHFQTFMLFRWSRVRHDAIRVGIETKNPVQSARILSYIAVATLAGVGTRMGLKELFDELGDDEEDSSLRSILLEFVNIVPFVGSVTSAFMYNATPVPVIDIPTKTVEFARRIFDSKHSETRLRAISDFITSVATLAGIPGSIQTQQLLRELLPKAPQGGSKTKARYSL